MFDKFLYKLIDEISYRNKTGIVNLQNLDDIYILSEILTEWGLGEIKHNLIENLLTEKGSVSASAAKQAKDMGLKNIAFNYYSKTGEKPATHIADDDKIIPVKSGEFEKDDAEISGEEPQSQPQDKKVQTDAGEDSEEQESKSSVDPSTSDGLAYVKSLGKKDPAYIAAVKAGLIPNDDNSDGGESTSKPIEMEELSNEQEKTSKLRDKGEAGAGGAMASQGESRYCNAVDNLDYAEFGKQNRKQIDNKKEELKSKNNLSSEERDTLSELGFEKNEDGKYSDEAYDYLATREVWAEQELARMTDPSNQPNVYTSSKGFGKNTKAYLEWMRAAFDGALATQEILRESRMDTTKPIKTIQSTSEIDDRVEASLVQKLNDPNLSEEDRLHYESELKSFRKFRQYHDTYVVGEDEKGRTFIVSVSNKKSSKLDDPQNNTTPKARFGLMKKGFGEKVAKRVTLSINDGIRKVTSVQETTRKSATTVEIDDDFTSLAKVAAPKRVKELNNRAGKRGRIASGDRKGLPSSGNEFGCWLEDNNVSQKEWDNLSTTERLKFMQKFMGDDEWHIENKTSGVPYEPYSKIFIKVGEAMKGGRGFGSSFWKKNPQAAAARESKGAKQCEDIKTAEQETVKEAHQKVVSEITEADKEMGYPKDGKNGPHTQAYIGTVMQAMHFDSYIDLSDEDNDKMIIQMGIVGAKPSNIRECLAEQSGYQIPPGNREGLKKHLRETCSIEAETGAIIIKSKDKNDRVTKIADDTWRTAGTSQKVASGFGDDMRECVRSKVRSERQSPTG